MTEDLYKYNKDFRIRIIALCLDDHFYARYGSGIIKHEYFEDDAERMIVKSLLEFASVYNRPPDKDELFEYYTSWTSDQLELIDIAYEILDEMDFSFTEDMIIDFAKVQAMKLAVLASADDIAGGNLSNIVPRASEAMQVGRDILDLGMDFYADVDEWLNEDLLGDKIPTGIAGLDNRLEGGLARGELGFVFGPEYKTQILCNIGYGALSQFSRKNVVHITCEIKDKKVARRYAARLMNQWIVKGIDLQQYKEEFKEVCSKMLAGRLMIKQFPARTATPEDIKLYLDRLITIGFHFDVVILDYVGELKMTGFGERRHAMADHMRDFRAMASPDMYDCAWWTAGQTHRGTVNKEIVTLEDVSESYEMINVSDVAITPCQTTLERRLGLMRLFGAKARDGAREWMVTTKIHADSHAVHWIDDKSYEELVMTEKSISQENSQLEKVTNRLNSRHKSA